MASSAVGLTSRDGQASRRRESLQQAPRQRRHCERWALPSEVADRGPRVSNPEAVQASVFFFLEELGEQVTGGCCGVGVGKKTAGATWRQIRR